MRELFAGRHGRVAAGLLIAEFVAAMQALVIATVMPRVVADVHGLAWYGLAFGSFLAANFIFLPFAGPWADRYGTRRILSIALALLAVGLLFASASRSMVHFVIARFIEGSGAGLDYAVSFTAIVKTFPERQRVRMFSLISTAWVVPALVAPTLGALVATTLGWRWAFLGFVPFLAIAAVLVVPALDDRPSSARVDQFGALRMLFSRATLTLSGRNAAFAAYALLHAAFLGADAYVSLMLTAVRGLPLAASGVCITMGALGWSLTSLAQPALLQRFGARLLVAAGAALAGVASLGMAAVALGVPAPFAFVAWTLGGVGAGIAYPTLSVAGVEETAPGHEGSVSSAMLLSAILGMAVGVTLCGAPISIFEQRHAPLATAVVYAFGIAAVFAIALAAASAKLSNAAGLEVEG